ncbi:MAG TPA: anthrax toxin-like adenylyl cyclase domain-containing protein [Saprospiraceae bacterium]|nr:anthrax toxin-like adenylyl cyclase domain-containing protein [Saprospiraceae bacterium]
MERLHSTLVLFSTLLFWNIQSHAQCFSISLVTQAQVDSFLPTYGCTVIEGQLIISGENVINLNGLSALTQVGALSISYTSLTDLSGLESMTAIVGELNFYENNSLISLNGIQNLSSIGSIDIRLHQQLADITAFSKLTTIETGNLIIRDCNALTSLEGLHQITSIPGYLWIEHNQGLVDLQGLRSLTSVGNTFWINDNDLLTDLSGLQNLTQAPRIGIVQHANLQSLNGLQGITALPQGLIIDVNTALENILGLEHLESVGVELYIGNNPALTSFIGLSSLTQVGGDPDVTAFYPDGLSLFLNRSVTSLIGLESLKSVSAALILSDMDGLINLTGLEGLESVGGNFIVRFNNNLQSLSGLSRLSTIGRDMTITSNSSLSDCAVQAVCDYLTNPPGVVSISNPFAMPGCNSPEEILARCSPLRSIRMIDANPQLYVDWLGIADDVRDLTPVQILEADFPRTGIVSDGVSEIVLIAEFSQTGIVDFTYLDTPLEKPWGPNTIEISGKHYGFAVFNAPEDFPGNEESDKDAAGIHISDVFVNVAHSGDQVTEIDWPITIVRPPVILVHGTFDTPDNAWKTAVAGGMSMYTKLSLSGYKVFTLDYAATNGSTEGSSFIDNSHVLWENDGGIQEALQFYRDSLQYACTQVDIVGHSLGGIIPRIYVSEFYNTAPGYRRLENLMQGDINRLITIASTHFGSDLGAFKVFLEGQSVFSSPLAWTEGQVASVIANYMSSTPTSEAVLDQAPPGPEGQGTALTVLGTTRVPAHAIAGYVSRGGLKDPMYDPDAVYYTTYRFMSLLLYYAGALRESYLTEKRTLCDYGLCPQTTHDGQTVPELEGLDEEEVLELIKSSVDEVMRTGGQIIDIIDGTFEYPNELDIFKYLMAEVGMGDLTDPLLLYFVDDLSPTEIVADQLWKKLLKPQLEELVDSYLGEEETVDFEEEMIETLRFLVFNHDENDGTVRVESQLGELDKHCPDCVTVFENILHSYAPRYAVIQDRVLALLNGGMWHFYQDGFPAPDHPLVFYYPGDKIDIYKPSHTGGEAICLSGMLPEHARAYAEVADEENAIVILRPVNPDGLDLLETGAATKKMDVKPKSSNWGPQKGYLPVNQRYSKIPLIFVGEERKKKIDAYNIKAMENLIDGVTLQRHLKVKVCTSEFLVYIDHAKNAGDDDPDLDDEVVLVPVLDNSKVCTWRSPFSLNQPIDLDKNCVALSEQHVLEPLFVMASAEELEEDQQTHRYLTADYDLLMVGFYKGENNPYDPPMNIEFQPGVGQITPAQISLVQKLNQKADHVGGDLTHHGPENQFSLSPYIDYPLSVFAPDEIPGPSAGQVITLRQGPEQFRDIHLKRYVNMMRERGYDLYDNPSAPGWKWVWNTTIPGFELADSPDLGGYIAEFPLNICAHLRTDLPSCSDQFVEMLPEPKPHTEFMHGIQQGMVPLSVFPNPSTTSEVVITLESETETTFTLTITDAIGVPVFSQKVSVSHGSNSIPISLSGLGRGLYTVAGFGSSKVRLIVL